MGSSLENLSGMRSKTSSLILQEKFTLILTFFAIKGTDTEGTFFSFYQTDYKKGKCPSVSFRNNQIYIEGK